MDLQEVICNSMACRLSISISKFIAIVATDAFPIGNVMVSGFIVCTIAGSFCASLQQTNYHVTPVSSIADTENLWVFTGKCKRPHCIPMLLSSG